MTAWKHGGLDAFLLAHLGNRSMRRRSLIFQAKANTALHNNFFGSTTPDKDIGALVTLRLQSLRARGHVVFLDSVWVLVKSKRVFFDWKLPNQDVSASDCEEQTAKKIYEHIGEMGWPENTMVLQERLRLFGLYEDTAGHPSGFVRLGRHEGNRCLIIPEHISRMVAM